MCKLSKSNKNQNFSTPQEKAEGLSLRDGEWGALTVSSVLPSVALFKFTSSQARAHT